jgi:formylglycine-generating enzyme required for sulfatase activity
MESLLIPAGEFSMGSAEGTVGQPDEQPQHLVYLDDYHIDKMEVTIGQFRKFIEATDHQTEAEIKGFGYVWRDGAWESAIGASWKDIDGTGVQHGDSLAVTQISWNDAVAYCAWVGGRLPTEAEWEKAARGLDARTYPWGNDPPTDELLYFYQSTGPAAVGHYPAGASPFGVLDMAGNVWEWVADYYDAQYYSTSSLENPTGPETGVKRVIRGGGWSNSAINVRSSNRDISEPHRYNDMLGFRCVR